MLPNTLIVVKNMSGFTMPLNKRNGDHQPLMKVNISRRNWEHLESDYKPLLSNNSVQIEFLVYINPRSHD
jgi:hypothetical protein